MITKKDKIEQFKRECKSNEYYTKCILSCNERIEELDYKLTGMGSNVSNDPKCENARNPYRENKILVIVEQDQIINERNDYIKRINDISSKLMKISNPIDRQMVSELLIDKRYYKEVVSKYHFNDYSALSKRINRIIEKIV